MNTSSLISSLLSIAPQAAGTAGSAAPQAGAPATGSDAQFKAQFNQAVSALAALATNATTGSGSTASASATGGASALQGVTNALQADLQKKIDDLLAGGTSIQQIVQQLAAALATTLAGQFGGEPATIQSQLQSAFASALSPPSGNGPPPSTADLASTLAQRFRQIADLAAGVIGETGQSNRLFAGSFSDAAITAGGQPAPSPTATATTTTDSIASDASALLANLTASQGDGKTVASTAPALGSNGDTLLSRILTRAANVSAQQTAQAPAPVIPTTPAVTPPSAAPAPAVTTDAGANATAKAAAAATLVDRTIAAASALLAQTAPAPAGPLTAPVTPVPVTPAATAALTALLPATPAELVPVAPATDAATVTNAPTLNPAVTAFLKTFTDALTVTDGLSTAHDKATANDDGSAPALPASVTSSQAPTIGAFAPVAPAVTVDATSANPTPSTPPQTAATPDQNAVIEQVLRGAFLSTTGPSSIVRLKLVPESLGDVSVRLNINGSSVDASVIAQTPAAHDALVAGQVQLTRALSDAGLKLTSFNVSLAGGFTSFQQQQQSSGQQQPAFSAGRTLLGDVDTPETDDPALLAIPSFAPSTATISGWGAYNYLV